MGKVLVVTSGKGGVGKTTVTVNVGAALAGMGHRVLVIDGDIGLRNLDIAMGQQDMVVYDYIDVINGLCDISQAIIQYKEQPRLYLLPAPQIGDKAETITHLQMMELCEKMRGMYEFVIIDSPAGIEKGFQKAIAGADGAIVVTTPSLAAMRDADRVIGLLEQAGMQEMLLVINRIRMDMIKRGDMMNLGEIIEILGTDTIGLIPEDDHVLACACRGKISVLEPDGMGDEEFLNIARRICGENVPIVDLEGKRGFWSRMKRIFSAEEE